MKRVKKILGVSLAALITALTCFSYAPVRAAVTAKVPQVQFVNTPSTEYAIGDRVRFDISAPNYGGKVEYRVVLWNDTTKTYSDLWNAGNGYKSRYYTKWQPWGNNVFTLGWVINEPGAYRITVYAKRVGVANSRAALKGMNCDSYKESVAFVVKPTLSNLNKDGQTYGSKDATKPLEIKENMSITAKNVTLNNTKITGNLTITGDNAVLNNVTVTGTIILNPGKEGSATLNKVVAKRVDVLSGGTNSIHIKDTKVDELNANSKDTVRIETDGDTQILSATATGYIIFDKKSGTYGEIVITKSETGETVVEFRGVITDKVVVESSATIKTTGSSSVENLVVAPENKDTKVVLQGSFNNVSVDKTATVELTTGTTAKNVEVKATATVTVNQGATVTTLDTNNNQVVVTNNGTVQTQENTGYVPPTETIVTNENAAFNAVINDAIAKMKQFNLINGIMGQTAAVPASGTNTTVDLKVNTAAATASLSTILKGIVSQINTNGKLTEADTRELQMFAALNNLLSGTSVNGTTLKEKLEQELRANGNIATADFVKNMDITTYNALYTKLNADPTKDYYPLVASIVDSIIPYGTNLTEVKVNGLTLQSVSVNNSISKTSTPIYNVTANDLSIGKAELQTVLGLGSETSLSGVKLNYFVPYSFTLTFKGTSGTIYTYTIKMSTVN